MDNSIHHLNPPATASVRLDPDAIWVGLNSDTSLIRDSTVIFKDLPDPGWSIEDFSDVGQIIPIDFARDPDWFREDEQWAPWIPTSFLLTERPWYDKMETAIPVEERIGGWCMALHFREACNNDLVQVQAGVRGIVEMDPRFPVRAKVPKFYPTQRLQKLHLSAKHAQIDAARAKRSVLQAIAFMSWWTAVISDWESDLFESMIDLISSFITTVKGRRGVICNLEKDWSIINIPLYIQNKIPFFYLWDFEARSDNRFSRLNPTLNMTYWSVRKGTPLRIPTDLEEDDLNKIARHAIKLDEFFQEVFSYSQPFDPPLYQSYSIFVIDFEGWKRRPIKYSDDMLTCLSKLYYYTTLDEGEGRFKTLLFWRWRKRKPTDEYLRRQYKPSLPELWRFSYGPKSGILYDIETGLTVKRANSEAKPPSLLQRISSTTTKAKLLDRLSDGSDGLAPDDMTVDDDSADTKSTNEEFLCIRFEELSDELYDPRAVNSPAAWIRQNDQKLERARRQAADRRGTGDHLFSTYATGRIGENNLHGEHLVSTCIRLESGLSGDSRLRYWANCWNTLGTVKRLLTTAIEHGIRFFLAISLDRARQFRPIIVDNLDHSSAASLYGTGFHETTLSPMDNGTTFCTAYLARMNDMLRRPHARAFIAEGGQLSWIARRWAGQRLVEEFMSGPSIQTTVHNKGFYDSSSEDASYLTHDVVSEQEKDLLLGYCPGTNGCMGRWLFPPMDIFEDKFTLWTGEWNTALDHCYCRLADSIARGKGKLRTREKWRDWIRNNERGQRRPDYLPTLQDFEDIMDADGVTKELESGGLCNSLIKGHSRQTLSSLVRKKDLNDASSVGLHLEDGTRITLDCHVLRLRARSSICDHYAGHHTSARQFHNGFPATLVDPTPSSGSQSLAFFDPWSLAWSKRDRQDGQPSSTRHVTR
ncbi:uncharacterized protein LACBIDRAFT_330399 [Laccaria bicolor S238N-H82]|uniref:Predicted protein n=1 Tax=Laccaria bicolor (strain S238N-H82 / ATCC MYA-4686) TaxID=486041 RepID=B0DL66_LACBS|nr:uncharacterized protein LACBIDRAFT_330399 [Laccaria bicolor S238N-H82]EDR04509.1 predicted protein [Laccaria bicolor S238N-H82]|eukprot:XP_001884681.1 predicted protein [Laccaria bicolor S238N-H82]